MSERVQGFATNIQLLELTAARTISLKVGVGLCGTPNFADRVFKMFIKYGSTVPNHSLNLSIVLFSHGRSWLRRSPRPSKDIFSKVSAQCLLYGTIQSGNS